MPHAPNPDLPMDVADVLAAMRQLGGYLDVAPDQALTLYRLAYAHAAARLTQDVPVAAIMTTDVTTAAPGDTVRDATLAMARAGVSGLPVVMGGAVVGVLSLKDVLRLLGLPPQSGPAALAARLLDPETCRAEPDPAALGHTPVARLMTSPAVVVTPDTPRSEAARLMAAGRINRLPVVEKGVLRGIVSRADVVRTCRGLECPL
ncbi:MAG TPA: CBS domain-containing protein [Solidesulfovibrio magneticus]|nr:CBS domain-containing protein [Solidesulfovibrio magneticus]